jgi:hypothetical protein
MITHATVMHTWKHILLREAIQAASRSKVRIDGSVRLACEIELLPDLPMCGAAIISASLPRDPHPAHIGMTLDDAL